MTEQTGPDPKPPVEVPEPRKTGRLRWRMAHEIVPHFWEPGLVDGVLVNKGMTIVYGPSGTGKTAVVVDLALRVASGMDWRACKVKPGSVIYIAAESPETTENRIWAWTEHHKMDRARLPLAVIEDAVSFAEKDVDTLIEIVREVRAATGEDPRLIVVDTLARTMKGDENTQQDMNAYVQMVDQLRVITGAHVLVVHHTGKDESRGARGSSVLKAATDHEIEIYKESGSPHGGVKLTKVRDGELEGQCFGFMLEKRVLGLNQNGRSVTTIVALEADEAPQKGSGTAGADIVPDVAAYIRGQGGTATIEELRETFGALARGKPASDKKAWQRFARKHFELLQGNLVRLPRALSELTE